MTDERKDTVWGNANKGELNRGYLDKLIRLTEYAMAENARILAIRLDLHLPVGREDDYDNSVIKRFIASLRAQVEAYQRKRRKLGKRVYPCRVDYAWVREFGAKYGNKHYHLLLLVNREVFYKSALVYRRVKEKQGHLTVMIVKAWYRALKQRGRSEQKGNIVFPSCLHVLNRKDGTDNSLYKNYLKHIQYLAKEYTKIHGDGERNFGCSGRIGLAEK